MKNIEVKHYISVDEEKCIGCRQCISDCPMGKIGLNKNNKATILSQDCMKCGHCTAVCPTEAISISGYEEEPYRISELKSVDPEDLLDTIIKRRTVRKFQNKEVSNEDFNKIIDAGRWTARGKNNQDVRYVIIEHNKENVEKIAVTIFRRLIKILGVFGSSYKDFEIDDQFFFKNAPLVIGVISNNTVDASLVAGNMTLMAESMGLGVLNSGFFSFAIKLSGKIRKILDIKRKESVITLVIGHPAVKYRRTAQKDRANIIRK